MIAADVQVGQPTADPAAMTGSTKPTGAQLAASWPATEASWSVVVNRVLSAPFALDNPNSQRNRRLGVLALLGWLREQPGDSWQQRWRVSGAEYQPDWRVLIGTDQANPLPHLSPGLLVLICADVIRPSLDWLLRFAPARHNLAAEMTHTRDRAAFAELAALCQGRVGLQSQQQALTNVAIVMAVKGGNVAAVRVGDCLELLATPRARVPPTTATPAAHCSINCCARTATSDRFQPQGLRVAGRQRHVLAELKDWDPLCGIATPSAASAIFFLSSVVSGVGERRRRELRNLNGLFEIFVAVSSRSPCIRSAKILEGSGDESRFG